MLHSKLVIENTSVLIMMAAAEARNDDDEVFVYMGGDQQVPWDVRRVRIHKSIKIIPRRAFQYRSRLVYVEFHDDIEIIEMFAFCGCTLLKCVKLLGVKIIKELAFYNCSALTDVEFGDELETIEDQAFYYCKALTSIKMPSVGTIGERAFTDCYELSDVECGEYLETLKDGAFRHCQKLKQIVLPLKDNIMIEGEVFFGCPKLHTVELVGDIHDTAASLLMESWRNEMNDEINRINQELPNTASWQKTEVIQQWIESVIRQLNHYKAEHKALMKEATTLLELALWKANLDGNEGGEREGVRTTRGSRKRARKEISVTSGANIVIKNVLPFLVSK